MTSTRDIMTREFARGRDIVAKIMQDKEVVCGVWRDG